MIRLSDLDLKLTPPRFMALAAEHIAQVDEQLAGVDVLIGQHTEGLAQGVRDFAPIDRAHEDLLSATDVLGPIPLTDHDHELAASATELTGIQSDAGNLHVGTPPGATPTTPAPTGPGGGHGSPVGNPDGSRRR